MRTVKIAGTLAQAPAFIAGIGSTIVTLPVSPLLASAMGILTIWSGYNSVVSAQRSTSVSPTPNTSSRTEQPHTLLQHALIQFHGPGFCAIGQATICLLSAMRALSSSDLARFFIFLIFSIGEAATAHLANLAYHGTNRPAPPFERVWTAIPLSLRQMALTPGISFATGNLSLIVLDLQLQQLAASWLAVTVSTIGVLLLITGIAVGMAPLYAKHSKGWFHPEYSSSICGIGDIALGMTTIMYGSVLTGVATLFWGYSNIILGILATEQKKRTIPEA